MKAAAIIAALGIALIVTMGPAPASAQAIVISECGDDYVVTRYNQDGSVKGVWNKQLSAAGTIYTAGQTWKLVEGSPDRFVSDGGAQLQVVPCDATPGSGTRGIGVRQVQGAQSSTTLVSNTGKHKTAGAGLSDDIAQAFTTGSHSDGYKLTSVQMNFRLFVTQTPVYSVYITEDSSGEPGTSLGTLTDPGTVPTVWDDLEFSASGDWRA